MKDSNSPRMQAALRGDKTFVGNLCKVCHNNVRYTGTGGCVRCAKRRANSYAEKVRSIMREAGKGE